MKPGDHEQLLSRSLDQPLPSSEQAELETALRHSDALSISRRTWTRIGESLREPVASPDPELVWQQVRRSIRTARAEDKAERSTWGVRLIWAAAALITIVVLPLIAMRMGLVASPHPPIVEVESVETDLPGVSTLVYEAPDLSCAMVWVSADEAEPVPRGI